MNGIVLTDDLIFFTRISGAARAVGLTVRQAKTAAELVVAARRLPPGGVILDLQNPGLDLPALLAELRAGCPEMPHVVAYGSHVDAAALRTAREAGCDRVLPRSKFVEELDAAIGDWLTPARG
ncbi:MAG: response regulator [Isosphaera sp.]|nr:response regulator [Isosphaera sp.]